MIQYGMLGAITGDVIGSVLEFSDNRSPDFPLFTEDSVPTDDSLLTCAIAEACRVGSSDYKAALVSAYRRAEATRPQPSIGPGWGGGFANWMQGGAVGQRHSFGNGAAMRVSPIAWAFDTEDDVLRHAELSARDSHGHPEGIRGAQCTALAVWTARRTRDPEAVRAVGRRFYDELPDVGTLREVHEYNETCQGCVPECIVIAASTPDFESAIRLACSIGGDADTLGAIAGSISEALHGGVPAPLADEALARLERWYPWAAAAVR